MRFLSESEKNSKKLLLLSFGLPFAVMAIIYALMGVYPFGNNTLMTIDLGQQYIDFFSYYRHTLLHEPAALFYSFAKGLGGDMVGLWAYYLNSPFNILLLLVPDRFLPVGVTILMLIKIACAGGSFAYLLLKKIDGKDLMVPLFSLAYALMAYTIVNQLNVMWLDGLVFLPLIVLGVEKIIDGEKGYFYSLMLGIMLFSNYYIGYMICLFIVLYFIFALVKQNHTAELSAGQKTKFFFVKIVRFAWFSLLGGGVAAFSLLPNFISLLNGKASYMRDTIDWSLKYPFQELLSKFYIGAFDFDQMPTGHPNLFIGTVAFICFFFYFFNRSFSKKERFISSILVLFFLLSMNVNFLNKVWHGMQYPIWYPYRFSFVVAFFFVLNGFRSVQRMKFIPLWFACTLLVLQTISALYVLKEDFSFVIPLQVLITSLFVIGTLVVLLLMESNYTWIPYVLLFMTIIEMSTNAAIDLTRLSYVKMRPFNDYQMVLDDWLTNIRPGKNEFYRLEKVFQRSKNDSFQANFPSATHFSSTFEREMPTLYGKLGFPDGNGFVSYSSGTLLTDALFGIRYYGEDKPLPENLSGQQGFYNIRANSTRPDLSHYDLVAESFRTQTYLNEYAFSLGFAVPEKMQDLKLRDNEPIKNQEKILTALSNQQFSQPFFQEQEIRTTIMDNVSSSLGGSLNRTYRKDEHDEDASIELQFVTETDEPYYLILDSRIDDDVATLTLNGENLKYYKTYRNDQILNVASGVSDQTVRFGFELLEESLTIRDLALYRLNMNQFEAVMEERIGEGMMDIHSFSQTNITGTVETTDETPVLMTTIPYSEGWRIFVDGQEVETFMILDAFLATSLEPGKHEIELVYRTPYLREGVFISLGSALFLFISKKRKSRPL